MSKLKKDYYLLKELNISDLDFKDKSVIQFFNSFEEAFLNKLFDKSNKTDDWLLLGEIIQTIYQNKLLKVFKKITKVKVLKSKEYLTLFEKNQKEKSYNRHYLIKILSLISKEERVPYLKKLLEINNIETLLESHLLYNIIEFPIIEEIAELLSIDERKIFEKEVSKMFIMFIKNAFGNLQKNDRIRFKILLNLVEDDSIVYSKNNVNAIIDFVYVNKEIDPEIVELFISKLNLRKMIPKFDRKELNKLDFYRKCIFEVNDCLFKYFGIKNAYPLKDYSYLLVNLNNFNFKSKLILSEYNKEATFSKILNFIKEFKLFEVEDNNKLNINESHKEYIILNFKY